MQKYGADAPTGVLADFTANARFQDLSQEVVSETKRAILDSAGCSLAGIGNACFHTACCHENGLLKIQG